MPQAAYATEVLFDFFIPAQPLAAALHQYAYLVNQPVVYPGNLAVGRMASRVTGRFTAEAALQMLLQGTGLAVQKLRTPAGDTFILSEVAPQANEVARVGPSEWLEKPNGFHGLLQGQILRALCAQPETAPGEYTALMRFSLDHHGRIQDVQLLDSTGDPRRDAAIVGALSGLYMAQPPEALVGHSLTMVILPRGRGAEPQCRFDARVG